MPLSTFQASNRELAAVAASVKVLGKEARTVLRERTRDDVVPMLIRAARGQARGKVAQRVVGTGRPSMYLGTPGVSFGGTRKVAGTATGRQLARPVELGSDGRRWRDYLERRNGGQVSVLRRTTRQFMPDATDGGKVIYPAAVKITDDVVDLWVRWVEDLSVAALSGEL